MKEKSWFEKKMDELKEWKEDHEAEIISAGAVLIVTAPIFLLGVFVGKRGKKKAVLKAQAESAKDSIVAQIEAYNQGFSDAVANTVIKVLKEEAKS